jgi:hypothetical protein
MRFFSSSGRSRLDFPVRQVTYRSNTYLHPSTPYYQSMTVGYCKIFTLAVKILNENGYLIIPKTRYQSFKRVSRHTLCCREWRAHARSHSVTGIWRIVLKQFFFIWLH